ncbi:unnamed protein product [Larinioides sclopetarius]|uniref:Uncharacterized protein n=1 Tax=Larinioides sclopetarius TaxID=280406 RepID=A0AAV1YQK2_9ARAC
MLRHLLITTFVLVLTLMKYNNTISVQKFSLCVFMILTFYNCICTLYVCCNNYNFYLEVGQFFKCTTFECIAFTNNFYFCFYCLDLMML